MSFQILIVEDQEAMALAIKEGLMALLRAKFPGCVPRIVGTMAEALRIAYEEPPQDMTILDLELPDSGWRETASKRVQEFESRSPVVIVTGYQPEQITPMLLNPTEIVHKAPGMIRQLVAAMSRSIVKWKDAHGLLELRETQQKLEDLVRNAAP